MGFTKETGFMLFVFEYVGAEEFQSHRPLELGVLGLGRVEQWRAALRLVDSPQRDSQCRLSACADARLKLRFHRPP